MFFYKDFKQGFWDFPWNVLVSLDRCFVGHGSKYQYEKYQAVESMSDILIESRKRAMILKVAL